MIRKRRNNDALRILLGDINYESIVLNEHRFFGQL